MTYRYAASKCSDKIKKSIYFAKFISVQFSWCFFY